ncbi:MAG: hypothetical protein RL685_4236 [Pseudomonadota bacterium]|jgi:hypothetical protein
MMVSVGAALVVTLAVEVPIVALAYPRERARLALVCALATSVTNLAMNVWLVHALSSREAYLLWGELGASVLEALAYAAADRRHELGRALVASGLANALSFSAGLWLF